MTHDTMSRELSADPSLWPTAENIHVRRPVRRLRGLRMPVLPGGTWLAQVGGGIAATLGTYLQWGAAATLIVGGIAAVVLGALKESDRI